MCSCPHDCSRPCIDPKFHSTSPQNIPPTISLVWTRRLLFEQIWWSWTDYQCNKKRPAVSRIGHEIGLSHTHIHTYAPVHAHTQMDTLKHTKAYPPPRCSKIVLPECHWIARWHVHETSHLWNVCNFKAGFFVYVCLHLEQIVEKIVSPIACWEPCAKYSKRTLPVFSLNQCDISCPAHSTIGATKGPAANGCVKQDSKRNFQ